MHKVTIVHTEVSVKVFVLGWHLHLAKIYKHIELDLDKVLEAEYLDVAGET